MRTMLLAAATAGALAGLAVSLGLGSLTPHLSDAHAAASVESVSVQPHERDLRPASQSVTPPPNTLPQYFEFQATLRDRSGALISRSEESIRISIYDDVTSSTPCWTETHTKVPIRDGRVSVLLGSKEQSSLYTAKCPQATGTVDLWRDSDATKYIGIAVGNDSEIQPRRRFTSVPYAFSANRALSSAFAEFADVAGALGTEAIAEVGARSNPVFDKNNDDWHVFERKTVSGGPVAFDADDRLLSTTGTFCFLRDVVLREVAGGLVVDIGSPSQCFIEQRAGEWLLRSNFDSVDDFPVRGTILDAGYTRSCRAVCYRWH